MGSRVCYLDPSLRAVWYLEIVWWLYNNNTTFSSPRKTISAIVLPAAAASSLGIVSENSGYGLEKAAEKRTTFWNL